MAIGYFIRLGDKTSCGGSVLQASSTIIHHGLEVARVGDSVSCGKDGGIYHIAGGIQGYIAMGLSCAGTLDSFSTCSCRARLYASEFSATYEKIEQSAPKIVAATAVPVAAMPASSEPVQHAQSAKKPKAEEPKREPIDAGFCIVDLPSNVMGFGNYLFYNPVKGARELYDSLNGSGPLKKGSILLLVDPEKQDPHQIETLKKAKVKVDTALADLTPEEADLLYKNRDAIAAFNAYGSKITGIASEVGTKYFEEIESILKDIEKTYYAFYVSNGTLLSEQFYIERQVHFKKLDLLLNEFIKSKLGMKQYDSIRKALGLSTRSIMHEWNQSGAGAIEGYATHIERSAKLVKYMKRVGYVGIAFDFGQTSNNVYDACKVGRDEDCIKASFTEYSKFAVSEGMGALVGPAAGIGVEALCAWGLGFLSIPVGGTAALVCPVIGALTTIGVGEVAADMGEKIGQYAGEKLYGGIYGK